MNAEQLETSSDMATDVRTGLTSEQKTLSPKYFYDELGSRLFEQICDTPEYYQTRTERQILQRIAPEIVARYNFSALVEYGSGNSTKTRVLLDAMKRGGGLKRYIPIDVSSGMLLETAGNLEREYPELDILPVIGDFNDGLPQVANELPALVIFLGGTIGNFRPHEATAFLRRTAATMREDDLFLLGTDLIKDPAMLNAAYNDAAGVTAEFNRNVLRVINRELGARFDLEKFSHYSFYNPFETRIEMHLVSVEEQTVPIHDLDMEVSFEKGETIFTEISRKFNRRSTEAMLNESGMKMLEWHTDPDELFALSLAKKKM
jgi:L-histidine N-alpha-methyltransferase